MSGGTLLCADYQMKLNDFYGNATQKWQLIYKATKNGFDAEDFHRCADNKGPTMTVIQVGTGDYLFGGYAQISWGSDNKYKVDPAAFIFTLTNPHGIQPTKFFQNPGHQYAVCHGKTTGPCFGGVVKDYQHFTDILIANDAKKNQKSHSDFPATYLDTTNKGDTLFTGTQYFTVKEIEVYQCCNEPK
ncbi:unnamed protein product [Rotaria sordida]|uniref:TLDc domain-containing protein n=1 Tax=Rotaria sordida TaxID=392033 RepID=A0A815EEW6_9BILA|nr:unnamed protein product [Rotaria sordida]